MNAMKAKLIIGTAALAVMQLYAVPTAARRAEAVAEATKIYEQLTPDETVQMAMMDNPEIKRLGLPRFHWWSEALHGYARAQFGMDGKQSLAKGEYTVFVGGGQPGFAEGVQSANLSF